MAAALSGATLWGTARAHNNTFLLESLVETDSFITSVILRPRLNNDRFKSKLKIIRKNRAKKTTRP